MRTRLARFIAVGLLVAWPIQASAGPAERQTAVVSGARWLASVQNPDGSWGASDEVRPLYTSVIVEALRAHGPRSSALFRGQTWLANHAMVNSDFRARRVTALVANGDDVSLDQAALLRSFRGEPGIEGWGLSGAYSGSPFDTGLVLTALSKLRVDAASPMVSRGVSLLASSQDKDDGSWSLLQPAAAEAIGDPIVTSVVLRGLRPYARTSDLVELGDLGSSYLTTRIRTSATTVPLAYAAFGVLSWNPAATTADRFVDVLVTRQQKIGSSAGSWDGELYATGMAVLAIATRQQAEPTAQSQTVVIRDFAVRSALNRALGRPPGDVLLVGDLSQIAIAHPDELAALEGSLSALLRDNPALGRPCDVNGNGRRDPGDALLALQLATGELQGSLLQHVRADVAPTAQPGNGVVDPGDVIVILRGGAGCPLGPTQG